MQGLIHRHLHTRKVQHMIEPGSGSFWVRVLEKTTLVAGVLGPIMVAPQIYKIYSARQAVGVSALSWVAFAVLDIPFVFYGIVHKDKPIVMTYSMFFIANLVVGIGAILYH